MTLCPAAAPALTCFGRRLVVQGRQSPDRGKHDGVMEIGIGLEADHGLGRD